MTSFMGPMAPPQAAQPQPQKLDIRTNPSQRQQFKQFMRQRSAVMPMQPSPMSQAPMMPPMQPAPVRLEMGGSVDIFDPMYAAPMMAPPAPMGFGHGGDVPPRRADIRGQDHMLSYITPDEADILEALGGSGEAGPMGIPAFPPGFGSERSGFGSERAGGAAGGPSGAFGGGGGNQNNDRPSDNVTSRPDRPMSPGRSAAEFGTPAFAGSTPDQAQNIIDQINKDSDDGGGGLPAADVINTTLLDQAVTNLIAENQRNLDAPIRFKPAPPGTNEFIAQTSPNESEALQLLNEIRFNPIENILSGVSPTVIESTISPAQGSSLNLLGDNLLDISLDTDAQKAIREANQLAAIGVRPGEGSSGQPVERAYDVRKALENNRATFPGNVMDVVELPGLSADEITATPFVRPEPGMAGNFGTGASLGLSDEDFSQDTQQDIAAAAAQNAGIIDGFNFSRNLSPDEMIAARNLSQQMLPIPNELSGRSSFTSGGVQSPLQQTMESYFNPSFMGEENLDATQTDLKSLFGEDSETYKNIMERATPIQSDAFPTAAGIVGKVMGGANVQNIINKINEGGVPQLDAQGNIQGVVHEGIIPGTQVYTGNEGFNPFAGPEPEKDSPSDNRTGIAQYNPCPDGFKLVNGVCTPVDQAASPDSPPNQIGGGTPVPYVPPPVVVASTRQQNLPTNMQGPVGYGTPVAGQAAPSVASNAAFFQQMLNQQGQRPPLRLQDGGSVSTALDQAAGNFLKALQPAA